MFKFLTRGVSGIGLGIIGGLACATMSNVLNPPQYGMRYAPIEGIWPGLLAMMIMAYFLTEAQATRHAALFKRGIYIQHGWVNLVRVVVAFALASLINCFNYNIVKVLDLTLFGMIWFSISFNYLLNKKRGLPALYLGKGKRASLIDKIFARMKNGGRILLIISLVLMIISGYAYCI